MGMTDGSANLAEICRRAEQVCQKYHSSITCEAFSSDHFGKYAALRQTNAPSEGQLGLVVTVTPRIVSQIGIRALVQEIEQMPEVWRVFLAFPGANSLS